MLDVYRVLDASQDKLHAAKGSADGVRDEYYVV